MELKNFIKKALSDIVQAVDETSEESRRKITLEKTAETRTVEFDVAVTVDEGTDIEGEVAGKVGIKVVALLEGKGKIVRETKNSRVSRVKFGVNVKTLTKEEERRREVEYERSLQEQEKFSTLTNFR